MAERVRRLARGALRDCFVLMRQTPRRYEGAWHLRDEVMFPGYVFLVANDPAVLSKQLELLSAPARLVRAGDAVSTLEPHEIAFIEEFGGPEHTVALSVGRIVNGELQVTQGPLKGRTDCVVKIDRHKRMAYLAGSAPGGGSLRVGLEVVSKT